MRWFGSTRETEEKGMSKEDSEHLHWMAYEEGLEKAEAEDKILLLMLTVSWCRFCQEMEEITFGDPRVREALKDHFVLCKADADRHPDLDQRFNMGGWPSIAFISPTEDLIAGDTYLSPEELLPLLPQIWRFYQRNKQEIKGGQAFTKSSDEESPVTGPLEEALGKELVETVVASMLEKFDHSYGGWGEGQKFPHTESLDFAMIQFSKTGDPRMREVVTLTLDQMIEGGIHDAIDGGFFRFSKTRDWRVPNFEKVLDNNAQRLRCLIEAWQLFGKPAYKKAAQGVIRWMTETMLDPETGGFFGSQRDEPDYYTLGPEERKHAPKPAIDHTIYANWNAMAVNALFKASVALDRPELSRIAERCLNFLLKELYSEKDGMYHYWDGTYHLPGLLTDQAYCIQTLIQASQFLGNSDLLLPAERLGEILVETHRSPSGGFYDHSAVIRNRGHAPRRNRSILENSVLAEALTRLALLSRREEFRELALEIIQSFAADHKQYGYFVAGFARAVDLILYPPLVVTIVGDRESASAKKLRIAAQKSYIPSRIVQMLDPKFDPILLARSGLKATEKAKAYLSLERQTLGVFEDPEALVNTMKKVQRERGA
jgi:uncharacterized protein YyaL (SSP411 family)